MFEHIKPLILAIVDQPELFTVRNRKQKLTETIYTSIPPLYASLLMRNKII